MTQFYVQLRRRYRVGSSNNGWHTMAPGTLRKYAIYPSSAVAADGTLLRALFSSRREALKEARLNFSSKLYEFRVEEVYCV